MKLSQLEKQVIEKIKSARTIAIFMHNAPDGDCIGSAVALEIICKKLRKNVDLIIQDKIPTKFAPIVGQKRVGKILLPPQGKAYDLAILVDCADPSRTYENLKSISKYVIVLDHHPIPKEFGDLYLYQPVAATAIIIYKLVKHLTDFNSEIANALYFAIVSDTGGFKFDNTNPLVHHICSHLLKCGANINVITKMLENRTLTYMNLLGLVLPNLCFDRKHKILVIHVTKDQIKTANSSYEEAALLIEQFRDIEDFDIIMLFIEGISNIRIRARSQQTPVNEILKYFGGGGHPKAAGCAIDNRSLYSVIDEVVEYTKSYLDQFPSEG